MPELPEVETLKRGLQKYIVGKTIMDVDVIDRKLFSGEEKNAVGATITGIRRYAKGIVIDLDNEYSFAIHIKLTGQLIYRDEKIKDMLIAKPSPMKVPNKFTRVKIELGSFSPGLELKIQKECNPSLDSGLKKKMEGGGSSPGLELKIQKECNPSLDSGLKKKMEKSFLFFQEVRGFAWMKLVKAEELFELPFFKTLGPEPSVAKAMDGQALSFPMFEKIVQNSNLPIKVLLMEQKKIGGVGNIYANDACFGAYIHPRRKAKTLSSEEIQKLYTSLIEVLEKGLKYRGSSELNFVDILGAQGEYQKYMLVYGRKGKMCIRNDGGVIEKIYLGGRGTFFCLMCQK